MISDHAGQCQGCQPEPRQLCVFSSGLNMTNFLVVRCHVIYAILTMISYGNRPRDVGIHPSVSYDTCIYFAVASKMTGMGLEYLTRLWRPALANTHILNKSTATTLILYLQGKPLTLAEHTLLRAKKFLDAFRAVISKQEETSHCPDVIKPRGMISFASEINPPEAMGPPSLTHGWLRDHYH